MIKILDVGSASLEESASDLEEVFTGNEKLEITRLDIRKNTKPDIVHDITKPLPERYHEAFDVVFASHVMEHLERVDVLDAFQNCADALRIGGEFYVIVPSLEYVAAEIYFGRMTSFVQSSMFGGQGHKHDFHKVGFTLDWLRFIVEHKLRMPIRKAYQAPFTITSGDGKSGTLLQNIVIGLKVEVVPLDVVELEKETPPNGGQQEVKE